MKILAKATIKKTAVTIQKRPHGFYIEWIGPKTQGIAGPFTSLEAADEIFSATTTRLLKGYE
jgi:hypothetical protein